jgi:hypothetical protein
MAEPPEKPVESKLGGNSPADATKKLIGEAENLLRGAQQAVQDDKPIGTATKDEDGTIHLHLRARGPVAGETTITYGPKDPQYKEINNHLGGINAGETKQVKPWSDQIKKGDLGPDDRNKGDKPDVSMPDGSKPDGPKPDDKVEPGKDKKVETPDAPPLAVTATFKQRVEDAYSKIPKNVRDQIEKDGVTVVPTDKITDVMPDLKGKKPRGWPPDSSWEDVDGAYDVDGKRAIVAERQNAGNKPQNRNVEGLTRHEVGHAADATGKYSDTKAFKDAYDKDVPGIPKGAANTLEYFLQSGDAGHEETWAEGFAVETGGASQNIFTPLFNAHFVESMKIIRDQMSRMK